LRVARPSRDANVLTVTWRGHDPEVVPAVPNSLVDAFIINRIATRKAGARSTVAFLNNQIDTLANELKAAELELRGYREAQGVVSFDEQAKAAVGKLADLQADRAATAAELSSLEGTLRDVQSRPPDVSGVSPWRQLLAFPTLLRIPSLGSLLESLNTLEGNRSDLLVRRTPRDPDVVALTGQIQAIEAQVRSLVSTYMDGLRQQVAAADRTLQANNAELRKVPAQEVRLAELQRHTQILGDLFTLLQTKRKEAQIAQAEEDPSAQIVDFAQQPDRPISPLLGRNVAVSLLIGLMLAIMVAFARESLDTKLHTSDQLQETTGLAVLGIIPHFSWIAPQPTRKYFLKPFSRTNGTALAVRPDAQQGLREAFRALRVNIAFSSPVRPPKMLLVTSAFPSEGKSTSVANLARAMAEQQLRVLVVDADMRRGELHKKFLCNRAPGLSEILVGQGDAASVTQSASFDGLTSVDFISTGTLPPNPAELLGGTRFLSFLKAVEPHYDAVLLDSPPVNSVSDSLLMAASMDGVLLVARGGQTQRSGLRFAQKQLLHVRARILGAILNDYDVRFASYYGDYYNYSYAPADDPTNEAG
jgi:tyrosine-protein kinase Etk/Wzc